VYTGSMRMSWPVLWGCGWVVIPWRRRFVRVSVGWGWWMELCFLRSTALIRVLWWDSFVVRFLRDLRSMGSSESMVRYVQRCSFGVSRVVLLFAVVFCWLMRVMRILGNTRLRLICLVRSLFPICCSDGVVWLRLICVKIDGVGVESWKGLMSWSGWLSCVKVVIFVCNLTICVELVDYCFVVRDHSDVQCVHVCFSHCI